MISELQGRRIQIAGSANVNINSDKLSFTHELVKIITKEILKRKGGLVIGLGEEPFNNLEPKIPIIFDWSILEAIKEYTDTNIIESTEMLGPPIILVTFSNWMERIPDHRISLWKDIQSLNCIELVVIPQELTYGGILRRTQATFGDILITLGGSIGVYDLSYIYSSNRKSVIPLDLSLNPLEKSASEKIVQQVRVMPETYFEYAPKHESALAFSRLSLQQDPVNIEDFKTNLFNFLSRLSKPKAFYVRLLNRDSPDFPDVESFFRDIVDPIIVDSGYERYEAGTDISEELFMNVEIFKRLSYCSLVIVDLTGIRPNCCIEFGYSLGKDKKVILAAKKGTKLPWDVTSIQCHFWEINEDNETRKNKLKIFLEKNINKKPIIS